MSILWTRQQTEQLDQILTDDLASKEKPAVVAPNFWIPDNHVGNKVDTFRTFLRAKRDKEGPAAAGQALRAICKRDLFYLAHQVLGYKDLSEPLHSDYCRFLQWCDANSYSNLTLFPRSHYKTSIGTTARSIWWLIRDPETAIGLGSATLKDCRPFGRDIKGQAERNIKLKTLFPDVFYENPLKGTDEKWTEEEFSVKRKRFRKESSVTLFGLEDDLPTGRHFDKILNDDAINKENVRTPARMEKIADQANLLPPLLVTLDQPINWVGTHYHLHDYYMRLRKDLDIKVYLRRAIENGLPIFPQKFSLKALESLRTKWGNYLFQSQYLLDPTDPSDKKFRTEWLQYFHEPILPGKRGLNFFLVVDPASRRRKESDFTAMLVFAVDHDWNFYLVDGVHDKLNPFERINKAFNLCKKWNILHVGWETIGFQETDKFYLERMQREKNFYFNIHEIKAHKERKDDRIMGIQPTMQAGKFWVPAAGIKYRRSWVNPDDGLGADIDIIVQLIGEMEFFPDSVHDDLLDAAAMARGIVYQGYIPIPEAFKIELQTAYGRKAEEIKQYTHLTG